MNSRPNQYPQSAYQKLVAAAAGQNGLDISSGYGRGIIVFINVTAITGTTPTLTVTLKGKDPVSGQYYTILASAAISATGFYQLKVYPGLTAVANSVASDILPVDFRIDTTIGGTTPAVTATISYEVIE